MGNVHTLKPVKPETYEEALNHHMAVLSDEEKNMELKAGIIIFAGDMGLAHAVLTKTSIFELIGMLESAKQSLLYEADGLLDDEEDY